MGLRLTAPSPRGPRAPSGWLEAEGPRPVTAVAVTALSYQGGVCSCPTGPLYST